MGPLGVPELIFIFILALLIFGPKRLPEIGRTIGKGMAEFRKASNEIKRTINTELALEEAPAPPIKPWEPMAPPQMTTPRTLEPPPEPAVEGSEAVEPPAPEPMATIGMAESNETEPVRADQAVVTAAVTAEPLEPR